MFLTKKILVALILPPTGPILLALLGLWLQRAKSRRWQHGGIALAVFALLSLLLFSLPLTGRLMLQGLEIHPPIGPEQMREAQAIVILGGGTYHDAPEYGGDTVGIATLERLRYGARLGRDYRLPVLVTGGAPFGARAEAESMQEALTQDFGIAPRWVETASRDTVENAIFSAALLKPAGITRIVLVSHAMHLPRAVPLFEQQGLLVFPAPTGYSTGSPAVLEDLLPGGGLGRSRMALNEYLGMLFNRIKDWMK